MSEEFKIQCEVCGTIYNDLEEVCPYCGTPQPEPTAPSEEIIIEEVQYPQDLYVEEEAPLDEPIPDDAFYPDEEEELPEPDDFDDDYLPEAPFVEDDIFAVAGETDEIYPAAESPLPTGVYIDDLSKPVVYDDELEPVEALYDEEDAEDEEEETAPRFQRRGRLLLGCLGAFICIGVLYAGIGVLAAYNGLQERAADVQSEAQESYQRGEAHLTTGNIELAIAEFERALSLNPN
ncbi:MAG: hypothetical protein KDF65_07710, partial [Anaerolineae bacterium]|nr:hypothetical protein [Anaerolineae bacterium]